MMMMIDERVTDVNNCDDRLTEKVYSQNVLECERTPKTFCQTPKSRMPVDAIIEELSNWSTLQLRTTQKVLVGKEAIALGLSGKEVRQIGP